MLVKILERLDSILKISEKDKEKLRRKAQRKKAKADFRRMQGKSNKANSDTSDSDDSDSDDSDGPSAVKRGNNRSHSDDSDSEDSDAQNFGISRDAIAKIISESGQDAKEYETGFKIHTNNSNIQNDIFVKVNEDGSYSVSYTLTNDGDAEDYEDPYEFGEYSGFADFLREYQST